MSDCSSEPITLAEFHELHEREGKLIEDLVRTLDLKEDIIANLSRPGLGERRTAAACDALKLLATYRRSIELELARVHTAKTAGIRDEP